MTPITMVVSSAADPPPGEPPGDPGESQQHQKTIPGASARRMLDDTTARIKPTPAVTATKARTYNPITPITTATKTTAKTIIIIISI